jgi:hypothetical protein
MSPPVPYATQDDILHRFQLALINEAADTDSNDLPDTDMVVAALSDAEALVNATLQHRYTLPFLAPVPPLIREITAVLAAEALLRRHLFVLATGSATDPPAPRPLPTAALAPFALARQQLTDLARGVLNLAPPHAPRQRPMAIVSLDGFSQPGGSNPDQNDPQSSRPNNIGYGPRGINGF